MNEADRQQLEICAKELGATIVFDAPKTGPFTDIRKKVIHLLPVDVGSFMGALHELGHVATTPVEDHDNLQSANDLLKAIIAAGDASDKAADKLMSELFAMIHQEYPPVQFDYESQAWNWGVAHANRDLLMDDRNVISWSLATYLVGTFMHFGHYPIEGHPRPSVIEIVTTVGSCDFRGSDMAKWNKQAYKHQDQLYAAWLWLVDLVLSNLGKAEKEKEAKQDDTGAAVPV